MFLKWRLFFPLLLLVTCMPVARAADQPASDVQAWCSDLRTEIKKLKWKLEPCEGIDWKVAGKSVLGRPLIYAEFGDPASSNTTIVYSMVHSDEVTPLYLGLQLARWMSERKKDPKVHVVIAPLVNPDGFFRRTRTRTNWHKVDLNRNFATKDWDKSALALWKKKFASNARRYPGPKAASEPETIFQQELIQRTRPQKILSIHAPLNFMDYDGPTALSLARFPQEYVRECLKLRKQLKAVSGGFFPGSLGNYGGQELGIPTVTLELPSADPRKAEAFWKSFSTGIATMIEFVVPPAPGAAEAGSPPKPAP